ncbi:MAG: ABC transporter permease [Phycisphaerales bacterium]|nr:ABC transporter permease [Phycisphaerales bacterium]
MAEVTLALVRDTFREAFARKIFWGLFGFATVLILFFLFIMKIDVVEGAIATISLFGNESRAQDVNRLVRGVHSSIAAFLYSVGLFLFVFASAGLIPTVFEPGRIELLLSKPVARAHILLGRYLGNLLVVSANMIYLVLAIWVIFGVKTDVWGAEFLYSIAITIFTFAVLLTVVLLVAVLSESAVLATIVTFGVMIIGLLVAQRELADRLLTSEFSRNVVRTLYYVLPKVWDLGDLSRRLVMGQPMGTWMPVWSTALFGLVTLGAGLVVFTRKNY